MNDTDWYEWARIKSHFDLINFEFDFSRRIRRFSIRFNPVLSQNFWPKVTFLKVQYNSQEMQPILNIRLKRYRRPFWFRIILHMKLSMLVTTLSCWWHFGYQYTRMIHHLWNVEQNIKDVINIEIQSSISKYRHKIYATKSTMLQTSLSPKFPNGLPVPWILLYPWDLMVFASCYQMYQTESSDE